MGTEVISLSIFLAAAITVIVWLLATRDLGSSWSRERKRTGARRFSRLLERIHLRTGRALGSL